MRDARMKDTIAAVSTPPGRGGIGIVRVSGPRAGEVARGVAGRLPEPRVATAARFRAGDGETLDTGIALWFSRPPLVYRRGYPRAPGARRAGGPRPGGGPGHLPRRAPGPAREFTERAFLNGKLDLAQAEAVADLIDAATDEAARLARRSLDGALSERVNAAVAELVEIRTLLEGSLDFPDEEVPDLPEDLLAERLGRVRGAVAAARGTAARGNLLREGFGVVIVGRPNVGKSSLLNRLVGRERAIVTEVPGTTRDTLHEPVQVDGLPLRVVDTAGLHPTEDPVERIGIERDVGGRRGSGRGARGGGRPPRARRCGPHHSREGPGASSAGGRPQQDRPLGGPRRRAEGGAEPGAEGGAGRFRIRLSAKTGEGVERLCERLKDLAGYEPRAEGLFMARRRHLVALDAALAALDDARRGAAAGAGSELVAEDLRLAQRALGEITGELTTDDLLGRIFATFCIGK